MLETIMLVISDDTSLIGSVDEAIRSIEGLKVASVSEIDRARFYDRWERVGLILIHLKRSNSDSEVIRLLRMISAEQKPVATLVVADDLDADQALSLLRQGVADCLGRPLDLGRVSYLADALTVRAREATRGLSEGVPRRALLEQPTGTTSEQSVEADDPFMSQVRRVAPQDATILLGGETGTGKSRLAHQIHELSSRRSEPFVVINCGSSSASRIETEMFGHSVGSYDSSRKDRPGKFAEVGKGTLFLDEIDALPLSIQPRLLKVVEDRAIETAGGSKFVPVRARLIVASNRELDQEVEAGRFRSDLYYRINVIGFRLAPLRERKAEIPGLVSKFLAEFASARAGSVDSIAAPALRALEEYDWPGNIRELRNTIERAVSLARGREIQFGDLPESITRRDAAPSKRGIFQPLTLPMPAGAASTLAEIKRDAELARITEALEKHSNNRLRAACELGISRMTLYKKLYKYGLMNPARVDRPAEI